MNLRQLEIFWAVMRTGSITGASKLLAISQPAVSKMLRHTEDQLRMELFVRKSGKLHPSEKAIHLFTFADEIFRNVDRMRQAVFDIRDSKIGRLQIVTNSTIAESVLPQPIARLLKSYPRYSVSLKLLPNNQIINRVAQRQADIGILFGPADDPFVEQHDLCRMSVNCAINRNHHLSGKAVIVPADLAGERVITFHRNIPHGQLAWEALEADGFSGDSIIECNHTTAALALVQAKAGIALMPAPPSEVLSFSDVVLRRFLPAIDVLLQFLLPPLASPSPALEQLLAYVRDEIAGWTPRLT